MEMKKTAIHLRKFGLVVSVYFVFFTLLFSKIHHHLIVSHWGWYFFGAWLIVTIACPRYLLPFDVVWSLLLNILRWVNTRILMGVIFFLIFSPIALYRRLVGKDVLNLSHRSQATYRTCISNHEKNDLRRPF